MANGVFMTVYDWDTVPAGIKPFLKSLAVESFQRHKSAVVELSDEQLKGFADNFVFGTGWTSDVKPNQPAMAGMTLMDGSVQVGRFKEDLPPSQVKQAKHNRQTNPNAPTRYLIGNPTKPDQVHRSRKANAPAYFRARMDKNCHMVQHDYIDGVGMFVPMEYIEFDNGGTEVSDREIEIAYRMADDRCEKAIKAWNHDLCVFLWRKAIYNSMQAFRDILNQTHCSHDYGLCLKEG
ncbi:hypothetical protein PFICI_07468 [Pestalotiopsis fici W106-1]|uniref:Uncharacterized protein n=1 Tax=Pestalotiopsis fici (strain W106-1 / CGMCC3.15140) TaxID=1229662 RepID=W3X1P6_PESFW|nr:uncharacterized protein PFICI_07468 [Pestalotiopsis fici W106-1]ETS79939.1 hypothetical protein PFICI_07468 [Pestalotiopsis fici W106-1]